MRNDFQNEEKILRNIEQAELMFIFQDNFSRNVWTIFFSKDFMYSVFEQNEILPADEILNFFDAGAF